MRAITFETYGGSDVLNLTDDRPVPGIAPDEVLVRVRFAAVNPFDLKLRSGSMQKVIHPTFPLVPGSEMAGTVEQLGADVSGLVVGDEVFGWATSGSYAEFAAARVVAKKPHALHWEAAASLPVAADAATRGLGLLRLQPHETLLIHGGAGVVGSLAVQLAVRADVTVIATCSASDTDAVRHLGAHPVLYGEGVFERVRELAPDGVDAVLDAAGAGVLPGSIELVGGTERVVTLADPAAYALGVTFSSGSAKEQNAGVLSEVAALVVEGALVLPVARHFALADAAEAQDAVAAGGRRGKVLLDL
ncbi:NADP-dependent oxidoreductase [Subtercola sp. PAMC28395]|uniref:NADP-dependent oxidoreductase n=1 Tax=Subtercola sp. PAMC28395 TaxID=2846775 RepID=UPI001C0B89FD|nr:NADP-dependent oxidoreductase [Subtercola sp. PAMC28395]QWT24606.1 NADP-dependent oxidoreductase [Subtercola sp. PAMC28395]